MLDTEPARDRALDFHWRVPENILSAAGIPDIADRRQDLARRSVLAAACIAADLATGEGAWVSFSRRKAFYAGQSRYQGLPYTYDRVLAAVAELVELGLIEEMRAAPGDHLTTGMQSRLRATPDLVHAFRDAPFEYETRRSRLILKDEAGDVVGYDPTRQTRRLEAELDRINAYLGQVSVTMPTSDGWEHATRTVAARNDKRGTWSHAGADTVARGLQDPSAGGAGIGTDACTGGGRTFPRGGDASSSSTARQPSNRTLPTFTHGFCTRLGGTHCATIPTRPACSRGPRVSWV